MLEKASWSETPVEIFPASCDSEDVKEMTSSISNGTRLSSQGSESANIDKAGDICEGHPILGDKCATADNTLYRYPLNHISQIDNDLSFLENDYEDKESSDLLYQCYGWPDIGNFEDVDRMFRSCDSTFGLGSLSNEDDLCWFAPANAAEDCEVGLKSGSKLKTLPGHLEASRENDEGPSTSDWNHDSFTASDKMNFKSSATNEFSLNHSSFESGLDTSSENMDVIMFSDQKKQMNHQYASEGTKGSMGHDCCASHSVSQNQRIDMKHLFGDSSPKIVSPSSLGQHEQNFTPDSLSYLQTKIPYMHVDYSRHPSDNISVCPTPSIKSENNSHMSASPKESSYTSNQMHSLERFHGPSFEAPSFTPNESRENLLHSQGTVQVPFSRNFKHENTVNAIAFDESSLSMQKQVRQTKQKTEGHGAVEGVIVRVPADMDSANAQESSCLSSLLDEVSLEATSFRQLQQVTEKLDIRTKLCIRDSLYRLSKSAEQRHHCENSSTGIGSDRDAAGAVMSEETNKCAGFIDMETDTNPIDRSIAHLLFHRPSDTSVMSKDTLPFKPHRMLHSSIESRSVNSEKQVCTKGTNTDEIQTDR